MWGAARIAIVCLGLVGLGPMAAAQAQTGATLSPADARELIDAARASAKAARENADHARVVPDILTQILAKLDKLENKLDKIENAVKANGKARR